MHTTTLARHGMSSVRNGSRWVAFIYFVRRLMPMNTPELSSTEIGKALHRVFDTQILNYGAYNLVFASGSSVYANSDVAAQQQPNQNYFLVGYRDTPREAIIAPLALPAIEATGVPTSVDNTNAMRTFIVEGCTYGIELTNGTSFTLTFEPLMPVESHHGSGVLDQQLDIEDFKRVIIDAWQI